MSGADIAADIAAAAPEIAREVGNGTNVATFTRAGVASGPAYAPTLGAPVTYAVPILVDSSINVRNAAGTLTGEIRRVLTLVAGVVVPVKGDDITVRGVQHGVLSVETVAPGGVDLLYKVELER